MLRNQKGHWEDECLKEFHQLLGEAEQSGRALEATIYSVVEADRGPNRFLVNLALLTLHNIEGDKIGKFHLVFLIRIRIIGASWS